MYFIKTKAVDIYSLSGHENVFFNDLHFRSDKTYIAT